MPRLDYKTCKECGRHASVVGMLSRSRLCTECAHRILNENVDGIHHHRGPAFDRWRRSMALSVGAILIDDVEHLLPDDG